MKDDQQVLAIRKVVHANYERFINGQLVFNTNGIYQYQSKASYFSVGAALGYFIGDAAQTLVTGGLWYWSDNALIPYIGLAYKDLQFGISYDITTSKLNQAARKPNTWEFSMILRGTKRPNGIIPCPWK